MEQTNRLALPYIMPAQAQKHVTHNEALRVLDAVVQLSVTADDLTAPPGSPAPGSRYIVAAGASGDWSGRDAMVASFDDGTWSYHQPQPGWLAWIESNSMLAVFDGGAWQPAIATLPFFGINATADVQNRLAVKAAGSLFDNEGSGHRLVINKADSGDTASLIFQTGYAGHAEFGLAGDDNFHVKASADGQNWNEALVIDGTSGNVTVPQARLGIGTASPSEQLEISAPTPKFKVTGTQYDADIIFSISDEGNLFFRKASGDASWNFRVNPLDGTSPAKYLFGQSTGSTGATFILLFNPDNSQQARLASPGNNSFACAQGGNFGIGSTSPDEKLRVAGNIKAETLLPISDNSHNLGSASLRYKTVFAGTGSINTSDEALKYDIRSVPEEILDALRSVTAKLFRFRDAVETKGPDKARWHYGYVAQELEAALTGVQVSMDEIEAFRHAFLCRDEIVETVETGTDAEGDSIWQERPTGRFRYGLRYEELLALRDEMHRRDIEDLKDKVSSLQRRLNS